MEVVEFSGRKDGNIQNNIQNKQKGQKYWKLILGYK